MSEPLAVRLVDVRRLRPPRAELRLDVRVANDGDAPCWAVLPDTLAPAPRAAGAQVWSIAAWRLGELRRAFLLHATGDAGWYAVLVPPHARVTLAALPFAWWGGLPEAIDVRAEFVRELLVDGEPPAMHLGVEPDSDAGATVDASRIADPAAVLAVIRGTPAEPLSVTWTRAASAHARAALAAA